MGKELDNGLDNRQLVLNMIFNILSFVLNIAINFFITPYITSQLGSEAYGYVKLANDFANYATLISLALNSMASRFIMINLTTGKVEEAKKYFTSVCVGNLFIAGFLMLPSTICVVFLEKIISVPVALQFQVKLTFAITFLNFIFNLVFSGFSNCYYLTNRLEISAKRTVQSNLLRSAMILVLFVLLKPDISYIAFATLISSVYIVIANIYYTKKLTPEMTVSLKYFDLNKIIELCKSGLWNSITKLSQIFSSGLSLLITNILVSSVSMGHFSVAKTIPNIIVGFNTTVANIFSPNFLSLYAENQKEKLKSAVKFSMKVMCLFVTLPTVILTVYGYEFFSLWVPEQPTKIIHILSILTIINSCITGPMQPLYQVFTITNKIKQSSIAMIIYGFSSIVITMLALHVSDLGVYAVAAISAVGSIIVALVFHLPYAAIYLELPKFTFFPEIGKSIASYIGITIIGFAIKIIMPSCDIWVKWFANAIFLACVGFVINLIMIFDSNERKIIVNKIFSKIRHK